jgi:hypothetical protein
MTRGQVRQVAVLQRKVRGRVRLTNNDRLFFVLLYRLFPSILKTMTVIGRRRWCAGIGPVFGATGAGMLRLRSMPEGYALLPCSIEAIRCSLRKIPC